MKVTKFFILAHFLLLTVVSCSVGRLKKLNKTNDTSQKSFIYRGFSNEDNLSFRKKVDGVKISKSKSVKNKEIKILRQKIKPLGQGARHKKNKQVINGLHISVPEKINNRNKNAQINLELEMEIVH